MKKKPFKIIFNFLVILIVLCIVLYFSLKDNYEEIISAIINIKHSYIFLSVLLLILYRFILSIVYYSIVKINKEEIPVLKWFIL